MHDYVTGLTVGIKCKNVELGVLFHSSPERAYFVRNTNSPDCTCSFCCCHYHPTRPPCHLAVGGLIVDPSQEGLEVRHDATATSLPDGSALPFMAAAAATGATATMVTARGESGKRRRRRRQQQQPQNASLSLTPSPLQPRPVPLPVPFCLDSEAYADHEGGSPHARFLPFMHTLEARPRWVDGSVARLGLIGWGGGGDRVGEVG